MRLQHITFFIMFLAQLGYTQPDNLNSVLENKINSRTLTSYKVLDNGFILTETLEQIWENGNWLNVTRYSHFYDLSNINYLSTKETWDSTAWVFELQTWYTYDANGNTTEELSKIWDNGNWVNSVRLLNEYDVNQNIISETYQNWDAIDWINFERYLYTFTDNKLTEHLYQQWDGGNWTNDYRHQYTFSSNNLIEELYQTWGSGWVNEYRYQYTFSSNNLTEELYQTWQSGWLNSTLDLHTYDGNNNEIEIESKIWNGSEWVIEERFTNQYSNGNLMVVTLQEGWIDTIWSNIGLYTKYYNYNNSLIEYISQYWHSANGWINQQRWLLSYTTDNQLLDWTTQFWYSAQWENFSKLKSVFDNYGNQIIYAWEVWENSAWQNHVQLLFIYTLVSSVEEDLLNGFNYSLSQNHPNPFNPSTKISWQSPTGSHQTIKVFDVLGNEIATLIDEYKPAGSYEINFDASKLSSGVYFYQLKAGNYLETKKMILLR